ncbi:Hypothetical predicted protein [Scomber scombrus]|uniref:Uncharacterized protein n=1 Tax=Scomber scombrus TaxID=13677 RepID=A0AAV1QEE9_SCOSC
MMTRKKIYLLMWLVAAAVILSRGDPVGDDAEYEYDYDFTNFTWSDENVTFPESTEVPEPETTAELTEVPEPETTAELTEVPEPEATADISQKEITEGKNQEDTDAYVSSSSSAAKHNPSHVVYVLFILCML